VGWLLLHRKIVPHSGKVKGIGASPMFGKRRSVTSSSFGKEDNQMTVFQKSNKEKKVTVAKAVDTINDKYGDNIVT
jgi:hypothetical protein